MNVLKTVVTEEIVRGDKRDHLPPLRFYEKGAIEYYEVGRLQWTRPKQQETEPSIFSAFYLFLNYIRFAPFRITEILFSLFFSALIARRISLCLANGPHIWHGNSTNQMKLYNPTTNEEVRFRTENHDEGQEWLMALKEASMAFTAVQVVALTKEDEN